MTTITKKTPKTLKSIKPARGEFRYQGLSWVKDGIAVAATDGRWLTARATSLEEAATLIESAENPNEQLPPGAARLLRNADSNDIRQGRSPRHSRLRWGALDGLGRFR